MRSLVVRSRHIATALFISGVCLAPVHGAGLGDPDEAPDDGASKWGLGAGVGIKRSPYRGVGNDVNVLPLLSYENRYVRFFGTTLDAKLPSLGAFDFTLRAKYSPGEAYSSSDSSYFSGMEKRRGGLGLGFTTKWNGPFADVSFEWLHAAGNSDGNRLKLSVERSFAVADRLKLTPYAAIERLDSNNVDYYFGVTDGEARPDRPRYQGSAATNLEAGLRLNYAFDTHQNVFFDAGVQHWGSAITDSPLVTRSTSPTVRLGYLYRF